MREMEMEIEVDREMNGFVVNAHRAEELLVGSLW